MPTRKTTRSRKRALGSDELLVMEMQAINSAETQLSRMLERLIKAANSDELSELLHNRQDECDRILEDLESGFDKLETSPGRRKNIAAAGLLDDLREHLQEVRTGPALDAIIIAGIQKTEHYCIAAWGTLRSIATAVDEEDIAAAMERALKAGHEFDESLTELAVSEIMPAIMSEEEEQDAEGAD